MDAGVGVGIGVGIGFAIETCTSALSVKSAEKRSVKESLNSALGTSK